MTYFKKSTMTKRAHFSLLPQVLAEAIRSAKTDIHIAVCWFTLPELFEELLIQQRQGVTVHFIINFDQLNFSPTGLPFGRLLEAKVQGFGYTGHGLLHHKFVVIDKYRVLSGSYNWTRSQHNDSLMDIDDALIAQEFLHEWQRIRAQSAPLEVLDARQARSISITHLFQPHFFTFNDVRRHVVRGCNIWLAHWGLPQSAKWSSCLRRQIWFLPACHTICQKAVDSTGVWHRDTLMRYSETLDMPLKSAAYTQAKLFCKRVHEGDIVVGIENKTVISLGVIMSEPLFDAQRGLHCAVEWQILTTPKPFVGYKLPTKPVTRLIGGGLALVDAILRG